MCSYATILTIHISVFITIPLDTSTVPRVSWARRNADVWYLCTDVPFTQNGYAIVYYLLWLLYFFIGSLQVHYGYPKRPPVESLTHSGVKPPISLLYNIFIAIPFLPELKWVGCAC